MALRLPFLGVILVAFVGCVPDEENREPARPSTRTATRQEPTEIVFRARYYMSKECRRGPNGEYALGAHPTCEVVEVLRGQLKLERLIDVHVPEEVEEGMTYTFRWKPSDSTLKEVRKAESGGYKGIWLGGEKLELVPSKPADEQ